MFYQIVQQILDHNIQQPQQQFISIAINYHRERILQHVVRYNSL